MLTPGGKTVLFDAGMDLGIEHCNKIGSYLDELGVKQIDAIIVSHYHTDHIGCIPDVLAGRTLAAPCMIAENPAPPAPTNATGPRSAANAPRRHPGRASRIETTPRPLTLHVIAVNGAGVETTKENDLSRAVRLDYGNFRAEIGGDLSGEQTDNYEDIESVLAKDAGPLMCTRCITTAAGTARTTPGCKPPRPPSASLARVTNAYGHPTSACLDRLHRQGVKTYWTERGNGGSPTASITKSAGISSSSSTWTLRATRCNTGAPPTRT